jgi:hypothetical protein
VKKSSLVAVKAHGCAPFPKVTLPLRVPSPPSAENVPFRGLLHRWRPENPLDNPFTASDHSCSPQRSKRVAKTL